MKKLWFAILCIALMLCGTVCAEETSKQIGDFLCSELNEQIEIIGYTGEADVTELYIPHQLEDKPVTALELTCLPSTVKSVYAWEATHLRDDGWDGQILLIEYVPFDELETDSDLARRLGTLPAETLVLLRAEYREEDGGHWSSRYSVRENDLPRELDGRPCANGMDTYYLSYTHEGWEYKLEEYDDGMRICLMDCTPAEGQTVLTIPYELKDMPVTEWNRYMVKKHGFDTVVYPYNAWDFYYDGTDQDEEVGNYAAIRYMDYETSREDDYWQKKVPDLKEDQLAIVDLQWKDKAGNSADITMNAQDLPTEIFGRETVIAVTGKRLMYTSADGWTYYLSDDPLKAILMDKVPGDPVLVIPQKVDGYPVQRWNEYMVEKNGYKQVILPSNVWNSYVSPDGSNVQDLAYTYLEYVDYEQIQQYESARKRVPQMGENDLAILQVYRKTCKDGSSSGESIRYAAADLPPELLGKTCWNAMNSTYVTYTAEGWQYTLNEERSVARLIDCEAPAEGQTMLIVPETVNGVKVESCVSDIAARHGFKTLLLPYSAYLSQDKEHTAEFDLYTYWNASIIANSNDPEYYESRYGSPSSTELILTEVNRYQQGKRSNEKVEYMEVPTACGNYALKNKLSIEYNINQHTSGDYNYVLLTEDTIAITKYTNEFNKSVVVPARLDGKTVTGIMGSNNFAFYNRDITSLELPSSLTFIGENAFYVPSVKSLKIPANVTIIGDNAMGYNSKVSKLELPEGLTYLGSKWGDFYKVKSLTFPESLISLAPFCFANTNYKTIKLPETIKQIGKGAFSNMYQLTSLTLPADLTEIPDQMAASSERLQKITIPATVERIGAQAFAGCAKLTTVTFGKKDVQLTTVADGAFASTALKKISLPEGVTAIGKDAFNGCSQLTSVSLPSTLTEMGNYAFASCTALQKITLPEGLTAIPEGAFTSCKKLNSVTIPASVTAIDDYAFEGCAEKLTLIVAEDSYAKQWADEHGFATKKPSSKKK